MTIRTRFRGAAITLATIGVLAAGCSSAEPPPVTTAPPPATTDAGVPPTVTTGASDGRSIEPVASTPRCTTPELTLTLGAAGAAAGSVYQDLIFTNSTRHRCELTGFPGVSYVAGDDGHQVGPAAEMSGERGGPVILDPAGTAKAQLQLADVRLFDADTCMPTPVRGLRVYPPGDTASLFVPRDGTGCSATNLPGAQLAVQTVMAN